MFEKYLTKTGRLSPKQPQDIKNQWWTHRFQEVHVNTYDYSKMVYLGTKNKVEIICRDHGVFTQTPNDHLKGSGCPDCYGNKKKDTNKCIEDFKKVHGSTYNYSKVNYVNAATKVEIICREHGVFTQTPNNHPSGCGCPKCQNHNQDTLYILKCLSTGLIKIGITNNLKQRISSIGGNLQHISHVIVENPRDLEQELHKKYQKYNKFNHNVKSGGTEFFDLSDQQLQEIVQYVSTRPNQ